MRATSSIALTVVLAALGTSCSSTASTSAGGDARVTLDGRSYEIRDVSLMLETGEEGWYRIDGEPASHPDQDCVPGLGGGLGLYGDLPASVRRIEDLAGKRLRVDFSGDGDDANFCFVGMGGLAGAEEAWVTIGPVTGDRVSFSMEGTFRIYDENGDGPTKTARASGTAVLRRES